jgi:hypothetical protein
VYSLKLKKWPETELEYYEIIEGLGGFIWSMNHDLGDGRIEDPEGKIDADIEEARQLSDQLVSELDDKFGVIHPRDCPEREIGEKPPPPPDGKTYYWDWYNRMQRISYEKEYEGLICSACPFSLGVEKMLTTRTIPCSQFSGSLYRLRPPHCCGMLESACGHWTETFLYDRIFSEHGNDALETFKAKEKELEAASAEHQPA